MGKKILCIDDLPGSPFGEKSLEGWLQEMCGSKEMFAGKYQLLIEEDPDAAYDLVKADKTDKEIDLVLLDIEFDGDPLGSVIARKLYDLRPDIKVVVLTSLDEKGKKISLRQRENVWFYFVKADLAEATGITHLFRIVRSLLEDPFNEKWTVEFVPEDMSLTLRHPTYDNGNLEVPLTLKNSDQVNTLETCLLQAGTCLDIVEITGKSDGYILSKVVKAINDRIVEHTSYRTWGILNSRNCAKNAVKILLGSQTQENLHSHEDTPTMRDTVAALEKRIASLEKRIEKLGG